MSHKCDMMHTKVFQRMLSWYLFMTFANPKSIYPQINHNRWLYNSSESWVWYKMSLISSYHGRIVYNHVLKTHIADILVENRYIYIWLVLFTIYCAIDRSAYFHAKWFAPSMSFNALNRIWGRTYISCVQQMLLNLAEIRVGFKS